MMASAPDVAIRPAVAADALRIRALTRAAYAKWVAVIGREPSPMQADTERASREYAQEAVGPSARLNLYDP